MVRILSSSAKIRISSETVISSLAGRTRADLEVADKRAIDVVSGIELVLDMSDLILVTAFSSLKCRNVCIYSTQLAASRALEC